MYTWKGAFAPFTKHHGNSDLSDHVEFDTEDDDDSSVDWSVDGCTLTVKFRIIPDEQWYTTEIDMKCATGSCDTDYLDDDSVKDLIAEQLQTPLQDRCMSPVDN